MFTERAVGTDRTEPACRFWVRSTRKKNGRRSSRCSTLATAACSPSATGRAVMTHICSAPCSANFKIYSVSFGSISSWIVIAIDRTFESNCYRCSLRLFPPPNDRLNGFYMYVYHPIKDGNTVDARGNIDTKVSKDCKKLTVKSLLSKRDSRCW